MRAGLVTLTLTATPACAQSLEHIRTFVWDRPEDYFGGWSAITVLDDGARFVAIGDNAQHYEGPMTRQDGMIVDIPRHPVGALTDEAGIPYFKNGLDGIGDSEGLAVLSDGRLAVSFERFPRIMIYGGASPERVELPREALGLPKNSGVEALAADRADRLIAIPETTPRGAPGFPVWRQSKQGWQVLFHIARSQGFRPVSADVGPDDRLFVLERAFRGIGFQSRVRLFDLGAQDPEGITLWVSALGAFDNLEGLSVWLAPGGATRVTMISDDNHNWFQRTEIVEFRLTE